MASTLESTAKEWLNDPPWNKVFKNSFDVAKDVMNKGLVAVAAAALSVRFLVNLSTGELLCIVVGLNATTSNFTFGSLAGPAHATLAAYAAQDPGCIADVFTRKGSLGDDVIHRSHSADGHQSFMQYGPVIIMVQAILLIMLEKLTILFPRLSQKLERFYKSVVEEALLGKDPDVAEDFIGTAINTEKVLRQRQRDEICGALRNSSIFFWIYLFKNLMEVLLGIIFVVLNFVLVNGAEDKLGHCDIPMGSQGTVIMQCRQKRFQFYISILYIFNILLLLHVVTSSISIVWSLKITGLRRITSLMAALRRMEKGTQLLESKGEDFLFLFDLVAHTCGQPATLRVLSFTAPTFANLCQPELETVTMTETSIKITWKRAPLQSLTGIRQLELQRYVATIFPPSSTSDSQQNVQANQDHHDVEFLDLAGGKKEYVVTLSAIIEDAKMKGVKRITYLPPFPPHKLVAVNLGPGEARITWARPKGEFDKYILKVTGLEARKTPKVFSPGRQATSFKHLRKEREPDEVWLGSEELDYTVTSMKPGERYRLELRSITGTQTCIEEKVPSTVLVTKPLPPRNLVAETTSEEVEVSWQPPEGAGHSFLEGYRVQLREPGGRVVKEVAQSKHSRSLRLTKLPSATEYTVCLAALCREEERAGREGNNNVQQDFLESLSDYVEASVVLLPLPPQVLKLEAATPTSLKVKWEPAVSVPENAKLVYRTAITALSPELRVRMTEEVKEVEATTFTFSHLPEVLGSGQHYRVSVEAVLKLGGKSHGSGAVSEQFTTKPLPPEKLVVVDPASQLFSWQRSPSPSVTTYKLKIRRGDEKATDYIISDPGQESSIHFHIPLELELGGEYKVNIYSQVFTEGGEVESEPLFMKVAKFEEVEDLEEEQAGPVAPMDVFDAKDTTAPKRLKISLNRSRTRGPGDLLERQRSRPSESSGGVVSPRRGGPSPVPVELLTRVLRQVSREQWRENNPGEAT